MVVKICFTHSIYIRMYQIEIMQKNEDLFIEMSAMQRMKLNSTLVMMMVTTTHVQNGVDLCF